MRLGVIPFVNMAPHYRGLPERWLKAQERVSESPRRLGELAREGRVDAAPFSFIDGLGLVESGDFEWLGAYGVAGRGPIGSILLVGAHTLEEAFGRSVAVSPQTATTVRLLEVLLRQKAGVDEYRLLPAGENADLRLLIGDEALRRKLERGRAEPQLDLCAEWTAWTELPFVFARWALRRSLPEAEKAGLAQALEAGLAACLAGLEGLAEAEADRTGLPAAGLREYLGGIRFRLGPGELAGAAEFQRRLGLLPAPAKP